MKSPTRTTHSARKLGRTLRVAGTNARKTATLVRATGHVVARRVTLGAAALIDPFNADHVEFAKMVPEKTRAFSAAGMTWLQRSSEVTQRMASFATSEMATAARVAVAMAQCRTSTGVFAAQRKFATAWFARALSQSITLGSMMMRSQGAAMAPVHRTATANARRLSFRP
jgi:hypothetical protein